MKRGERGKVTYMFHNFRIKGQILSGMIVFELNLYIESSEFEIYPFVIGLLLSHYSIHMFNDPSKQRNSTIQIQRILIIYNFNRKYPEHNFFVSIIIHMGVMYKLRLKFAWEPTNLTVSAVETIKMTNVQF